MKFWDMIACGDTYGVSPASSQSSTATMDAQIVKLEDLIDELKQTVTGTNVTAAPTSESKTILKDKEVIEILDRLSDLQVKYFPEIPLNDELTKQFVWNIPRDAYKGMRDALDYPRPDILDPMMVLYLLLSVSPKDAIGKYWTIVNELIVMNEQEIAEDALEYDHVYDYEETNNENE